MRPLAARVLDMALTQLRSWRDDGVMVTVAVNLSTTNLLDLGLVASIARLLRTHDLPPESLILEITESTLTTAAGPQYGGRPATSWHPPLA